MSPNIARTGKVKMNIPKWGVISHFLGLERLVAVYGSRWEARYYVRNYACCEVVRLTGTVSYTVAK